MSPARGGSAPARILLVCDVMIASTDERMLRLTVMGCMLIGLGGCAGDSRGEAGTASLNGPGPARQASPSMGACPQKIALNTASEAELGCLPGIGKERIAHIVEGRPYWAVEDVVMKQVLSPELYDAISDRLVLN